MKNDALTRSAGRVEHLFLNIVDGNIDFLMPLSTQPDDSAVVQGAYAMQQPTCGASSLVPSHLTQSTS